MRHQVLGKRKDSGFHKCDASPPLLSQRKTSGITKSSSIAHSHIPVQQERHVFRLLDLPNDAASRQLRTRVIKRIMQHLLTESNNFILVQKVQMMALRFSRSRALTTRRGQTLRPARHFQHPAILYVNHMAHREGWRAALEANHFQFASLGIFTDFLSKIGVCSRMLLSSVAIPLWRENDLTEGHMKTIAKLLRDCVKLRYVKIMTRCSRVGCPVATENSDATEHSGDRLIYDLVLLQEMRRLPDPPKLDVDIDCCVLYTHGQAGTKEKHSHHDMLIQEARDWLSQPLEGPPNILEVLSRPAPKNRSVSQLSEGLNCKERQSRGTGVRRSDGTALETVRDAGMDLVPFVDLSNHVHNAQVHMNGLIPKHQGKIDDGDREWLPDD